MVVTPRLLKRGDIQFVTAIIIEETGADISGCTYKVAHILDSAKNDDQSTYAWEDPHAESESVTPAVYLVKKLVTAAIVNGAKTKYRVFVRVTDNPEVEAVDCGTYSVVP